MESLDTRTELVESSPLRELELWHEFKSEHCLWHDRFHSLLSIAENPLILLSMGGNILEFNAGAETHFGKMRHQVLGRSLVRDVIGNKDADQSLEGIGKFLRTHTSWDQAGHDPLLTPRNRILAWDSVQVPVKRNEVAGLIVYGKDITDAQELEAKLRRTLKELKDEKSAIDQAAIVAVTDFRGNITYANKKFCELSKYSFEELLGKNHRIIKSGHHPPSFFENLWRTIRSGKTWRGEVKNKAKDGSFYWVDTTIVPFLDEQGQPQSYVSIRYDITGRKMAEEQIDQERARSFYSSKLAALGEMAANMAHELGTPLATIRGRMEFLEYQLDKDMVSKEKVIEITNLVREEADRMTRIIKAVLSSARDGSTDPLSSVSVTSLTSKVSDYTQGKLKKDKIELRIKVPAELNVVCRESQMLQVLLNLLSNACDACLSSEERWVEVAARRDGEFAELSVTDTGQGIPAEVAEKIMQPFFTTKPVGKGTGLGLSISRSLIESQGGTLTLDRKSPHTRFVLRLPSDLSETKILS